MKFFLQFGSGMMAHCKELTKRWNGDGGVILSPRDLKPRNPDQLERVARETRSSGAEVLLDPQCYVRDADHHRLVKHDYFTVVQSHSTSGILSGTGASALLAEIERLNDRLGCTKCIVPGLLAQTIDDDWFALHEQFMLAASKLSRRPVLATIAIGAAAMLDEARIEAVVERAAQWDVSGFYVVPETPGSYLVENPNWLANLMILVSGLKLLGKYVLVGYSSHQLLALASAKVDAIASGNWLNVRAFGPDKFLTPPEDEVSRRAKGGWYYCATALSEYKMTYLDVASRGGILPLMAPMDSKHSYAAPLFSGAVPSSVNWGESSAFRHYLDTLHKQAASASKSTFDATADACRKLLDEAETLLDTLRSNGVFGQDREFTAYLDVNRSALAIHTKARGTRLRRNW